MGHKSRSPAPLLVLNFKMFIMHILKYVGFSSSFQMPIDFLIQLKASPFLRMFIMHILKKAGDSNNVKRAPTKATIAICGTSIVRFVQKCINVHHAHFKKFKFSNAY